MVQANRPQADSVNDTFLQDWNHIKAGLDIDIEDKLLALATGINAAYVTEHLQVGGTKPEIMIIRILLLAEKHAENVDTGMDVLTAALNANDLGAHGQAAQLMCRAVVAMIALAKNVDEDSHEGYAKLVMNLGAARVHEVAKLLVEARDGEITFKKDNPTGAGVKVAVPQRVVGTPGVKAWCARKWQ